MMGGGVFSALGLIIIIGIFCGIGMGVYRVAKKIRTDSKRKAFLIVCYIVSLATSFSGAWMIYSAVNIADRFDRFAYETVGFFILMAGVGLVMSVTGALVARRIIGRGDRRNED